MHTTALLALFLTGFLGGGHCVGMCGSLTGAFMLQLPPQLPRWQPLLLLNSARIASYGAVGLLLGGLGQWGISLDQTRHVQTVLFILAHLLLFFTGLYVAGLHHGITRIERLGRPIWQRINPLLNRLLPIRSRRACIGIGLLWGWLPCGLVYSASLYALGSGHIAWGGLYMLAFGLGTLPNLLLAGWFAGEIQAALRQKPIRLLAGGLICLAALWQTLVYLR